MAVKVLRAPSARERVVLSGALGTIGAVALAFFSAWQLAVLIGWDIASGAHVSWVWITVGHWDAHETETLATREDDSQAAARLTLLGASVASLIAVAFALAKSHDLATGEQIIITAAAALTVLLSWTLVHTVYAVHYARLYYTPPIGGIDFKSGEAPAYRDFAYVAFTVGMTYQVSDTDLQDRRIRHAVLGHAFLAYLFGAVILAVTVNLVANLL